MAVAYGLAYVRAQNRSDDVPLSTVGAVGKALGGPRARNRALAMVGWFGVVGSLCLVFLICYGMEQVAPICCGV
jgi:hypothetical protein